MLKKTTLKLSPKDNLLISTQRTPDNSPICMPEIANKCAVPKWLHFSRWAVEIDRFSPKTNALSRAESLTLSRFLATNSLIICKTEKRAIPKTVKSSGTLTPETPLLYK